MWVRIGQVDFTMHRMAYEECIFVISMMRQERIGFSSLGALIYWQIMLANYTSELQRYGNCCAFALLHSYMHQCTAALMKLLA